MSNEFAALLPTSQGQYTSAGNVAKNPGKNSRGKWNTAIIAERIRNGAQVAASVSSVERHAVLRAKFLNKWKVDMTPKSSHTSTIAERLLIVERWTNARNNVLLAACAFCPVPGEEPCSMHTLQDAVDEYRAAIAHEENNRCKND